MFLIKCCTEVKPVVVRTCKTTIISFIFTGISQGIFFSYQGFLSWTLTTHRTEGKRGNHLLFCSTTFTYSQTFRQLFATSHARWLSHTFNHTTSITQTATWLDLPTYRITMWWIDDMIIVGGSGGVGVLTSYQIFKKGGLTGPQLWEGVAGKERVTFFRGGGLQFKKKNKRKN